MEQIRHPRTIEIRRLTILRHRSGYNIDYYIHVIYMTMLAIAAQVTISM